MKSYELTTELFLIPYEDKFMVYAPLKRKVFLANEEAVELLNKIKQEILTKPEIKKNRKILETLEETEILNSNEKNLPPEVENNKFLSTSLTIIPTTNCNLRCVYCFSSAGEKIKDMGWNMAKSAIDLLISSTLESGKKRFSLGFHGGGEPTLRWDFLKKCINYAKKRGKDNSLESNFSIVTNGVLNREQREYIGREIEHIVVSLDGPKDIQNTHRPIPNGEGSFKKVYETLKHFDDAKVRYNIRSTISDYSVTRMEEIVDFVRENLDNATSVQFEPLFCCGRSLSSGWEAPDHDDFIKSYEKAKVRAIQHNIDLVYSGSDISRVSSRFCGASSNNCYITPDGFISSCIEVTSKKDPRSDIFFYGKYDAKKKRFEMDKDRLLNLRNFKVQNLESCQKCFLKWNCAGDCLSKRFYSAEHVDSPGPRCEINRSLAYIELKNTINPSDSILCSTNQSLTDGFGEKSQEK